MAGKISIKRVKIRGKFYYQLRRNGRIYSTVKTLGQTKKKARSRAINKKRQKKRKQTIKLRKTAQKIIQDKVKREKAKQRRETTKSRLQYGILIFDPNDSEKRIQGSNTLTKQGVRSIKDLLRSDRELQILQKMLKALPKETYKKWTKAHDDASYIVFYKELNKHVLLSGKTRRFKNFSHYLRNV